MEFLGNVVIPKTLEYKNVSVSSPLAGDGSSANPIEAPVVVYDTEPTYTTLWETTTPFANGYTITLNDSIDNYDELIYYGSADRGGTLTGDQIYIPGSTGITLQTAYDTYYRFSGYEVTGGTITDNVLVAEGPCTAKAVYKVNYFTATGNFNFATGQAAAGVASWSRNCDGIIRARTGSLPTEWGSNGSNFVPTGASAYKINWNTTLTFTGRSTKSTTGYNRIYLNNSKVKETAGSFGQSMITASINVNNNSNSTNQGHPMMQAAIASNTARVASYCTNCSPNGWTATGIAP